MNEKQLQVIDWWYGRRDYATGLALLSRYSKNKVIFHTLNKQGKENFIDNVHKLHYEVTKAVHLDWKKMPEEPKQATVPVSETITVTDPVQTDTGDANPADNFVPPVLTETQDTFDQYPKVIRRLLYESSNLYKKRSMLHSTMRQLEGNSPEITASRASLLAEIKAASDKLEYYFPFIESYKKTGIVPEEDSVWPEEKPAPPQEPKTPEQLRKQKWSLHRENTKDKCKLLYQQRTKAEKENPMPAGPKRDAIEARIKLRVQKISEIEQLIDAIENAH